MVAVNLAPGSQLSSNTLEAVIFEAATLLKPYAQTPGNVIDRRGSLTMRVDPDRGIATVTLTVPVETGLDANKNLRFTVLPFTAQS